MCASDLHTKSKSNIEAKPHPKLSDAPYESRLAYEHKRIHAAAIYCSDGRVGEHFDDFLQNGLGLPRYDRVALPGGPACMAGHPQAHLEEQGVIDELHFLVEAHSLKRIVLIAHDSCAFYTTRLELADRRLELVQRADLVRAAAVVARVTGLSAIEAYFARLGDGKVRFEPVEV
ncbi:MAG: carbonic anhydrase [Phycisphaerales bacterium]